MSARAKKTGALLPVYLISGTDDTKVEKAARRLRERIVSDSGTDLNVDTFDAGESPVQDVLQAANTMPFGPGMRLVMVTGLSGWNKADKDAVVSYLGDPPPYTVMALVGPGIRKNETLARAAAEAGQILTYDAPRPSSLPQWAQEQAAERGLKLGGQEARRLVIVAGSDQRSIIAELDKLSAYLGEGQAVDMEDIREVAWVSPEVRIWDLTDALGSRDREATFRHLEELLTQRTAPQAVFYSLARHLRSLCEVAAARERGEDQVQAAAAMGLKPFQARKAVEQSRNFSASGLRAALKIFSGLDADLKGRSEMPPELLLETAVARVLEAV